MTGYERALRTLRFQETDRTATWGGWVCSASFFEYVTGRDFWDDPRAVAFEAYRKLEVDIVLQSLYLPAAPDEWRQHTTEALDAANQFESAEDVVAFAEALPDSDALDEQFDFDAEMQSIQSAYASMQAELGDDMLCLPRCGTSRFFWYIDFGYENFLTTLALYPETAARLFEYSGEQERLQNTARAQLVRDGKLPPFFFVGQDICGRDGPLASPDLLRRLYFPQVRRALAPLVEVGTDVIWHCDGYIMPIIDDVIACGVGGFQGFQEWTGFDIGQIAQRRVRSGRKPILLAGLAVDRVLPYGSVADVEQEVERIINTAGPGGGLAIGTANTAGPDCPSENLEALYRHPKRYP